ncbi:hypothetical protein MMC19_004992 [Ptychographa xylographoides]|nr:hypothetical protein [Ptychographa xylographoides]
MEGLKSYEEPPAPVVLAPLPFPTRITYAIRLWGMKILIKAVINLLYFLKPPPPEKRPTYTKIYPTRPMISNRVFIPKSYKSGDKLLPLYIDIHGGGFALCDPRIDDDHCSYMAQKYGVCVVSIGYRRAPRFPFPTPDQDCAALAQAVLEDPDLPCDKSKVAIGGFSAGGKLSLSACQMDGLRGKITGLVGYYPIVDFTRSGERKMKHRPATPGKPDPLIKSGNWFNWGYIPQGTDRTDPLLSPIFAKRDTLPPKICLIGCEYDLLREEAEDLAGILAQAEPGERKSLPVGEGWEKGNIRWEKVLGQEHGFNQTPIMGDAQREVDRVKRAYEMYDVVADWLFRTVYL